MTVVPHPFSGGAYPGTYYIDISEDIGTATQVRFYYDGYEQCVDYWAVDDVSICYRGWWHVEDVAVDIIVTIEPPPVGGEAYPISRDSLLAPWIAVGMILAGGISWYSTRRRRAQS